MGTALIDGDIVAFRCAAAADKYDAADAVAWSDNLMKGIIADTKATEIRTIFTGPGNFRRKIYPEYKAHRKDKPVPRHLNIVNDFLIKTYDAYFVMEYEADDELAILHYQELDDSFICSIDKDLLQIPGRHYNFTKKEFYNIDEWEGYYNFYKQMLVGDRSDNVPGIKGIGEVKAKEILSGLSVDEMFEQVYKYYNNKDKFELNKKLLWIIRTRQKLQQELEEVRQLSFITGQQTINDPSTEPTTNIPIDAGTLLVGNQEDDTQTMSHHLT